MAEEKTLFPSTNVDCEAIRDGQVVALRFRSQNGEPFQAEDFPITGCPRQ